MKFKPDKSKIKFIILIALFAGLFILGRRLNISEEALRKPLETYPLFISSCIFILFYVVLTFFIFFVKDVFKIIGALIFGAYLSTLLITVSETVNAIIFFYLARKLGREFVEKKLLGAKAQKFNAKVSNLNLFWIFCLRATPIIPYRFLDLGFGLTEIKFKKYLIAVILGTPIRTFWVQYILAGVGKSIFYDYNALTNYFLENRVVFYINLAYIIAVAIIFVKLRKVKN